MTAGQPLSHARASEFLPWLVNGSLGAAERDAVLEHVQACIACRRELREQQRLHAALRAQPTVHVSAQMGLEQLDRQLDATRLRNARAWPDRLASVGPFAVAAAAGVALLGFLLWLTPLPPIDGGTYTTLATQQPENAALLDVVFAAQTTAAEMHALLDEIDGEIVAGPTEVGRHSVRIAGRELSATELERLVDTLARDPRVRFVGRSLADLPQ